MTEGVPLPEGVPPSRVLESRRITGPNVLSAREGAVVDVAIEAGAAPAHVLLSEWRAAAQRLARELGWRGDETVVRRWPGGASCFVTAPVDALTTATAVVETAWTAAEHAAADRRFDLEAAFARLQALADAERAPALVALHAAAEAHGVTCTFDDETCALGTGTGVQAWPITALPAPEAVDWARVHDVPLALVTGSNGKTTTTRMLAAIGRAAGVRVGLSSTDGVWVGDERLEAGDWAGPMGARRALQDARVQVAVLETARGGILRRGLAVRRASAACVTNIAEDHFGEYGVHTLRDLGEAKLVVARAVGPGGRVVLSADDATLVALAGRVAAPLAWTARAADHPVLAAHVAAGGDACTVRDGRIVLHRGGTWHDLLAVADIPATLGGAARHNVENALAAAMTAVAMGAPLEAVRRGLAAFGARPGDNPGRLAVLPVGGATAIVDYAHNPDGITALGAAAAALPAWRAGRRLLVLGQAGDRDAAALDALAHAAWAAGPFDRVIVKELPGYRRGRAHGEVRAAIAAGVRRAGAPEAVVTLAASEEAAVTEAVAWARPGDLLVLTVHERAAAVVAWLGALDAAGWRAGDPLPAPLPPAVAV